MSTLPSLSAGTAAGLSRRKLALLPVAWCWAVLASAPAATRAATLAQSVSLPDELAVSLRGGHPLVVMASLEGCPFCMAVRDGWLAPLHNARARL